MTQLKLGFACMAMCMMLMGFGGMAPAQSGKAFGADPALAKKMTSELLAARADTIKGKAAADAIRARAPQAIRGGQLQCILGLTTTAGDELLAACETAGLTIVGSYNHDDINLYNLVVRCSDPTQLDAIALRDDVRLITSEPLGVTSTGSVTAQSDASLNGPSARSTFSVDGSGIRIGVLSDSFNDTLGGSISGGLLNGSNPQNTGDLPANIRVIDAGLGGGTDEGAAMAELVYDLAPGCDIAFASAFTSYAAFATNITALRTDATHPSHVIVDDVLYFAEPMYQDGPIAIAARNCGLANVPFFSAAGNYADQAHERTYTDANPGSDDLADPPSGVDLHDFGLAKGMASDRHLQISLANNGIITVALHWDEPYGGNLGAGPGAEADLDLYLVNSTALPITGPMILTASTSAQGTVGSPSGEPVEVLQYVNTTGSSQNVYVVVDHYHGRKPVNLHVLVVLGGAGGTITDASLLGDRTLFGHAAAENVQAVAAIFYGEIDTNGALIPPGGGVLNVEDFSALGGALPIWFSDNGNTRFGAAVTRQKPDITAPDGANTTFFGQDTGYDLDSFPEFFGTSAAAPHAAGVAALVLERSSGLTAAQVYQALIDSATDAETAGVDALSGHGVIDAHDAVDAAPFTASVNDWRLYR